MLHTSSTGLLYHTSNSSITVKCGMTTQTCLTDTHTHFLHLEVFKQEENTLLLYVRLLLLIQRGMSLFYDSVHTSFMLRVFCDNTGPARSFNLGRYIKHILYPLSSLPILGSPYQAGATLFITQKARPNPPAYLYRFRPWNSKIYTCTTLAQFQVNEQQRHERENGHILSILQWLVAFHSQNTSDPLY